MKSLTRLLPITILAVALASCSERTDTPKTTTGTDVPRPDTEVRGAQIDLFEGKQITTRIQADKIVRFEAIDSTMGYDVHTEFMDQSGAIISTLEGDSAVIRELTRHLYVYGRVVVVSKEKSRLDTDYLHWNPDLEKIQTDAFVKVTRRGDVVTGWGLEADKDLTRIKILRQVSGTIHDAGGLEDEAYSE